MVGSTRGCYVGMCVKEEEDTSQAFTNVLFSFAKPDIFLSGSVRDVRLRHTFKIIKNGHRIMRKEL